MKPHRQQDIPVCFIIKPVHYEHKGYHANDKIERVKRT